MRRYVNTIDKSIVCPFYKWADENHIGCEGVSKGNTVSLVFGDSKAKKDYKLEHCRSLDNYKECLVCQMLFRKHYDEE